MGRAKTRPFIIMEKNVLIVHYNTPELTKATILSVLKHTSDCKITVFDNSNRLPFPPMDGVCIIDNTHGRVVDFDAVINSFQNRLESDNSYASAKHCLSVDYCFDLFEEGFVLLDSDVLIKKDITSLFDSSVAWVGQPHRTTKHPVKIPRLYPFCCFINTKLCREHSIRYFDREHMWQLSEGTGSWYDTGAWFLEATDALPHRISACSEYIIHYGGASFLTNKKESWEQWLEKNKTLYE